LQAAFGELSLLRNALVASANNLKMERDANALRAAVYGIYTGMAELKTELEAFRAMDGDKSEYEAQCQLYAKTIEDLQVQVVEKYQSTIQIAETIKGEFAKLNGLLKQLGLEELPI